MLGDDYIMRPFFRGVAMARRKVISGIEVVNYESAYVRDLYHALLRGPWTLSLLVITLVFMAVNVVFAGLYELTGGVEGAHTFAEYFFFSVETAGTVGYGAMHPVSMAANSVATVEALVSMLMLALTTGLVFSKFSIPRARVRFTEHPVIAPFDGVPTLQLRIGNQRDSRLLEATIRMVMTRTERTREGVLMYRMYDLTLVRERAPGLSRAWIVMHRLDENSPLFGATPESLARDEIELAVTLI